MSHHDNEPMNLDDADVDFRAPFTRRTFLAAAAAGAAAAAVTLPAGSAEAATADPVPPGAILRIHPAVGFGRLGNADASQFFVGPEVPGYGPVYDGIGTSVPNYKTADGKVKRQAARFRIFEYHTVGGKLVPKREVNLGTEGVQGIEWSVHLANKKAAFHGFEGGQGENREPAPLRNAGVTDPALRKQTLEIDFGPRSISGASQAGPAFTPASAGSYPATVPLKTTGAAVIDYLGELRTDSAGRLVVIPGAGKTGWNTASQPAMPHWANNDGWFDDASDGPVTAKVTLAGGQVVQMDPAGEAWVLNGPPDFAPGVPGSITGYDLVVDMSVRKLDMPTDNGLYEPGGPLHFLAKLKADFTAGGTYELPTYVPSFPDEIQPILVAAYNLWYVNELVNAKHNSLINVNLGSTSSKYATARKRVVSYMRPPLGATGPTGPRTMPKLLGDDPYIGGLPEAVRNLPLTNVQYAMLRRWADGNFTPGTSNPPLAITPHGLDKAALENAVGGAFFPGIEFGWQFRNPVLWAEPFRLDVYANSGYLGEENQLIGPGHFSRQMAVPWQADFNDCRNEGNYGWWPSQRPTAALPSATATKRLDWARPTSRFVGGNVESTHEDMVTNWSKFGFVVEEGNVFVEKERAASIA
ncbi:MAG: LodA/GoxA family CTQ-dependent oxidase [Myxococcales bacterium]|nr:LodA/GoxA family CTQ-dependent oxidase [Myxococcales bacterium]